MDIWDDVYVKKNKFYSKKNKSLLNGEIETADVSIEKISESEDEGFKTKLNFSKGVLDGKFEKIHLNDNKHLKFIGEFKNGKGIITAYNRDGNVISIGDYHIYFFYHGKDKTQPSFYLQILNEIETYDKQGMIREKVESFHENHKRLTKHHHYNEGKIEYYETLSIVNRHGEYKEFYENGNIKRVCEYKYVVIGSGGGKHGFYKEYYKDGSIKVEGSYRDDVKDGRWVTYHKSGEVESDGYHIKEKSYNEYGEQYANIRKGGSKNGTWKYFDDNGQLIKQESWHRGYKHGYHYEKLKDGTEDHSIYKYNSRIGQNSALNRLILKF